MSLMHARPHLPSHPHLPRRHKTAPAPPKRRYPPKTISGIPYNTEPISRAIDLLTGLRETLNQLALVGSFIAGVQVSMISFTFLNNRTPLKQATNALFFAGLIFDVVGTSIGLVNAVLFQKYIGQLTQLLASMKQIPKAMEKIQELMSDSVTETDRAELLKRWKAEHDRTQSFHRIKHLVKLGGIHFGADAEKEDHGDADVLYLAFHSLLRSKKTDYVSDAGLSAIQAIAFGVISLVCGVCCFAVDTQPFAVWLTTILTLACVLTFCGLPWVLTKSRLAFGRMFHLISGRPPNSIPSPESGVPAIVQDTLGVVPPYFDETIANEFTRLSTLHEDPSSGEHQQTEDGKDSEEVVTPSGNESSAWIDVP